MEFKRRVGRDRDSEGVAPRAPDEGRDDDGERDARALDGGREDAETTSLMQDSTRKHKFSDNHQGRSRKVKVSMATVLAITLLAVYCFLLGFALGHQRCSSSRDSNGTIGKIDGSDRRSDAPGPWRWRGMQRKLEWAGSAPSRQISIGNETYEVLTPPDGWETLSFSEIRDGLDCRAHGRDQTKRLYGEEQWRHMRRKYNEVVDDRVKFDDPVPPTRGYTLLDGKPPPFYARLSPGKGRGVFASRIIKRGHVVHHGDPSAVEFADAAAWRRFVFSLPRTMACDVVEWTWTQRLSEGGRLRTLMDMNIAALFNNGGEGGFNVVPKDRHSLIFYAARDIEKDSELLYNYDNYETNWAAVGLGKSK